MTKNLPSIAILGAGITGLCLARAFSGAGHRVTVFEPTGFPALRSASALAAGMLSPYSEIETMPPTFIEAAFRGIDIWTEILAQENLHRHGSLIVAHEEDRHMLERYAAHLTGTGYGEMINARKLSSLEPALGHRFLKGLFLPDEAHLDPQEAMSTLMEYRFERVTAAGNAKMLLGEYDCVIDARGFAAERDDPDLRGVKGEILTVQNPDFQLNRPVRLMHPRYPLYIVPRANHVFVIGATQIESAGDERVALRSAMELLSAAYSLHPSFGEAAIIDISAAVRPAYPDNMPRIRINGNIIHCNGLFRHGYLLAPVMAECVADHVAGHENRFMNLFTNEHHEHHTQWQTGYLPDAA